MARPNLFSYATSELSQDAFICWLLAWASPDIDDPDDGLRSCAKNFIHALFAKHSKVSPDVITKVEIFKQDHNIDVFCVINGQYALLIEDKTGTKNHSNQLVRYLEDVRSRTFNEADILPIYLKTQDQSDYSEIEDELYQVFRRSDFLTILNSYEGDHPILIDFREHLQSIANEVDAFRSRHVDNWEFNQWVGFFLRLQEEPNELSLGMWDYVANPRGGFCGFWWHFQGNQDCEQYLQLEHGKLCFKIRVRERSNRSSYRNRWCAIVKSTKEKSGLSLDRPKRFGNGEFMTVCVNSGDYRVRDSDGVLDIEKTILNLLKAQKILTAVNETEGQ